LPLDPAGIAPAEGRKKSGPYGGKLLIFELLQS